MGKTSRKNDIINIYFAREKINKKETNNKKDIVPPFFPTKIAIPRGNCKSTMDEIQSNI